MKIFLALFISTFLLVFNQTSHAKSEIIYSTFKYTMGDNDSKNDAKRIAFVEAKRILIEKVGVFVESSTTVVDSALLRDEIKTYSSAIIKAEIEKEDFETNNGVQTITVKVKAHVDTDDVINSFKKIRDDKGLQKKVKEQQKQIIDMQNKLDKIHNQITNAKGEKALELRSKRVTILNEISELDKIFAEVESMSDKVKQLRSKMTVEEMKRIAGKERLHDALFDSACNQIMNCYNYGKYWVVVINNQVYGYVPGNDYVSCMCEKLKGKINAFEKLY